MSENEIQISIIDFFRKTNFLEKTNSVLFCNPLADIYLGKKEGPRIMNLAKRRGFEKSLPDLFIYGPANQDLYSSLAIELKVKNLHIRKKNHEFISGHISSQAKKLRKLDRNGSLAGFATGIEQAFHILLIYFGNKIPEDLQRQMIKNYPPTDHSLEDVLLIFQGSIIAPTDYKNLIDEINKYGGENKAEFTRKTFREYLTNRGVESL